jgi:membrane fusion protein (multidrug efflux system)
MHTLVDQPMVNETVVHDRAESSPGSSISHPGRRKSAIRGLLGALVLVVAVLSGVVFGLYKFRVDIPALKSSMVYAQLDSWSERAAPLKRRLVAYFQKHEPEVHQEHQKIVVTSPTVEDVITTQPFVCQIHARQHIEVKAIESGYLKNIAVKEGQSVKEGDLMFKIVPVLYQAELDAANAEALLAQREYENTKKLYETKIAGQSVVSEREVLLLEAKLKKAQAMAELAAAKLKFTDVKAPFDGIIDRQHKQSGSLVKEEEELTTLSDNSLMWVYFPVPEKIYLQYMSEINVDREAGMDAVLAELNRLVKVELKLANQSIFPQKGEIAAIEAKFNNENGNVLFRADFPNPKRLLRHGQTGTVLISRVAKDAVVIPQRATFEILDKRYVWVVGEDHVAHQKLITIKHELDDIFVVEKGLDVNDKIVLEGVREVHDGEKVEYDFRKPEEALKNQKFHAE